MIVFGNPEVQNEYERAELKDIKESLRGGRKKTVRQSELGEQRNISHNQRRNPLFLRNQRLAVFFHFALWSHPTP